jgi:hypothetical protein
MGKRRNRHEPGYKARVALEAVRERKTVSELASQFAIHPSQVQQWKRTLLERAREVFEGPSPASQRRPWRGSRSFTRWRTGPRGFHPKPAASCVRPSRCRGCCRSARGSTNSSPTAGRPPAPVLTPPHLSAPAEAGSFPPGTSPRNPSHPRPGPILMPASAVQTAFPPPLRTGGTVHRTDISFPLSAERLRCPLPPAGAHHQTGNAQAGPDDEGGGFGDRHGHRPVAAAVVDG